VHTAPDIKLYDTNTATIHQTLPQSCYRDTANWRAGRWSEGTDARRATLENGSLALVPVASDLWWVVTPTFRIRFSNRLGLGSRAMLAFELVVAFAFASVVFRTATVAVKRLIEVSYAWIRIRIKHRDSDGQSVVGADPTELRPAPRRRSRRVRTRNPARRQVLHSTRRPHGGRRPYREPPKVRLLHGRRRVTDTDRRDQRLAPLAERRLRGWSTTRRRARLRSWRPSATRNPARSKSRSGGRVRMRV